MTSTSIKIRLGKAIRRLRTAAGLSQERFAAEAGINRGYMGEIERGEVNLSLENIEKVAQALKVTVGQFMTEVDKEGEGHGSPPSSIHHPSVTPHKLPQTTPETTRKNTGTLPGQTPRKYRKPPGETSG